MDGGEYSRGLSEEIVENTTNQIATDLKSFDSDFYFVQEVDIDGTRSYHINEYDIITQPFANKSKVFAQNYDSPYLLYPILEPHGKNQSGLATMSNYKIVSSLRRSLPIQGGFSKIVDLDRCYNISRINTANGKELVLINVHLSAYTTDPTIADQQLAMLYADMQAEYDKGNYVICGGDFNKDLLGDSASIFGISGSNYSWAQSFPFDSLPKGFTLVAPYDESNPIPSCRNADIPWNPETTFQITIDGFIISNNVECIDSNVVDLQFENSDHNPVYMNFKLK
jgi:endonuclease/exonuclease/phosphatase family metal-dependent hydrolase